ncbi:MULTISPECIES: hypothetical protein [unclassified Kitasatospora]|uniref:hypothetical protein n=1 Tax=unclassified Kitasatospora TaxID=2633591 RepID=UPI0033D7CD73
MDSDTAAGPLLVDRALPDLRFAHLECTAVDAGPSQAYRAARSLDLLSIHSPLLELVTWARGLPDRLRGTPVPQSASLRLADLFDMVTGDQQEQPWVGLGENPGREMAFGAVGKIWQPSIEWRQVEPGDFSEFEEPGWAKVAAAVVFHPYGTRRSLVTYEARTVCTDQVSTRRFGHYRTLVSPGAGVVMRATLQAVKTAAEHEATAGTGVRSTAGDET